MSLYSLSGVVKTGFVLRRHNQDKSQEDYNTELERMNAQISAENWTLQNDNKQLATLIKEYEQTLENVMTTFRTRANEVQQRELTLMREYERKLLLRETEELSKALERSTHFSTSLGRIGGALRAIMRALGGEDPSFNSLELDIQTNENGKQTTADERESELAAAEWALERECELTRLEQENRLLKQLAMEHAGIFASGNLVGGGDGIRELPKLPVILKVPARTRKGKLGGKGVGPFGMYKKFDEPKLGD
ncbi:hypothetical protein EW026_g5619 [Hermanssonia centrifuga]|uniref:Uncharacterized protein n=1 Tax=Hermanssonia centrifuga TaxID=98765 RepID=A0A4S4KFB5_9APHY|nr:hypothetical protein EW026_g5619 [Hermanssonia centrifuga]